MGLPVFPCSTGARAGCVARLLGRCSSPCLCLPPRVCIQAMPCPAADSRSACSAVTCRGVGGLVHHSPFRPQAGDACTGAPPGHGGPPLPMACREAWAQGVMLKPAVRHSLAPGWAPACPCCSSSHPGWWPTCWPLLQLLTPGLVTNMLAPAAAPHTWAGDQHGGGMGPGRIGGGGPGAGAPQAQLCGGATVRRGPRVDPRGVRPASWRCRQPCALPAQHPHAGLAQQDLPSGLRAKPTNPLART